MSQWTHVIATLYIDDIGKVFMGRPSFSPHTDLLPHGSEGPLQVKAALNNEPNAFLADSEPVLSRFVFTVWGDLRDYSNVQEIVDYLDTVCKPSGLMVREGIALINVEFQGQYIYHYNSEQECMKLVATLDTDGEVRR